MTGKWRGLDGLVSCCCLKEAASFLWLKASEPKGYSRQGMTREVWEIDWSFQPARADRLE